MVSLQVFGACRRVQLALGSVSSTLCYHSICRARSRTSIYPQGHYRILQHLPRPRRQARMAVPAQGTDTIRPSSRRLHRHQRGWHDGKYPSTPVSAVLNGEYRLSRFSIRCT